MNVFQVYNRIGTIRGTARELGCDPHTIRNRLEKEGYKRDPETGKLVHIEQYGSTYTQDEYNTDALFDDHIRFDRDSINEAIASRIEQQNEEECEDNNESDLSLLRQNARLKKELTFKRRLLAEAVSQIELMEEDIEKLSLIKNYNDNEKDQCIFQTSYKSFEDEASSFTPILFTSDFQVGEMISGDEMDGENEYNIEVFEERYKRYISQAIVEIKNQDKKVERVIYIRGGDSISGGIHSELKDTDQGSSVEQAIIVANIESDHIKILADEFDEVHVFSIPGNHGRVMGTHGLGNRCKGYVSHNIETIIAYMIEARFKNDDRVIFVTPKSGQIEFNLHGKTWIVVHGDRVKGGGSLPGIHNAHTKLRMQLTKTGLCPDYILSGHYHTSVSMPGGWGNGSLAGFGEYAKQIGAIPDAPKQWLLFSSEDTYGVYKEISIQVDNNPKRLYI